MDNAQPIRYPADLPITRHREEILDALARHQLLIVAGETGSGKSTQLPKMCLEAGLDLIGHTQPRRIAARSVAERVAEELGTDIGETVGYAVRFDDRVGARTRIKLMTDGLLLAEIQRDPDLGRYRTLIIDEAHERSLNIDFLLGYLKTLLPRRPELKVVITSATIDTERFSLHFADDPGRPTPIIEVSGRTYPVELRYRPLDDTMDQIDGITDAVNELVREGPGDILVFLPGERDIRDTADALGELDLPSTEIVPLFARLSTAEQHRIFASHRGRRIVLATNIAETSLTVPGIRYVIDPGTARISRYNQRTKVQRLPIEDISQASANQRSGRCGRIGPGIGVRLYSEEDFDTRNEFTDPEITRTNLASVILQMVSVGIATGGPAALQHFPFVDPPDTRNINDGVRLLEELGAVDPEPDQDHPWLTDLGRRLARLPLDPRIARMVIAADEFNHLDSVLVIAAAMSIQDPREDPKDERELARQSHGRFAHESSDMMSLLHLWDYVNVERRNRSSSGFRRMCRREYLHHNRIREWQDLYAQLKRVSRDLGLAAPIRRPATEVDADAVHRALLSGLLSQIGMKDERDRRPSTSSDRWTRRRSEYVGARNARFVIAPGSAQWRNGSRWVMAGELVETNRLYARLVAPIRPEWAEEAGAHLATYSYSDPRWVPDRGTATVVERVSLFGLPVVAGRTINLHRVDPELARELFIQHALVAREWATPVGSRPHAFLDHNDAVMAQAARWEAKSRGRDLEVESALLFDHYGRALPPEIVSTRHFDKWWKNTIAADPHLLDLALSDVVPGGTDPDRYPDFWPGSDAELRYTFDPGSPVDGVTVTLQLHELSGQSAAPYSWLVPGYRRELVTELLRTLPKEQRTRLVPLTDTAARLADSLPDWPPDRMTPIEEAVRLRLSQEGTPIGRNLLQPSKLPTHLRPTFQILDERGGMVAGGTDLDRIRGRLNERLRSELAASGHVIERTALREWPGGTIPRAVQIPHGGAMIDVYPALVDRGDSVDLRVLATEREQTDLHWGGVRRLVRFSLTKPARAASQSLTDRADLALGALSNSKVLSVTRAGVVDDLVTTALDSVMMATGGVPWAEPDMRALIRFARQRFRTELSTVAKPASLILERAHDIVVRLDELDSGSVDCSAATSDVRTQLAGLVYDGSYSAQGADRLTDIARYLEALLHRCAQLPVELRRDDERRRTMQTLQRDAGSGSDPDLVWMLQELRVSLWAQHLGTPEPISVKRIRDRLG